MTTPPSSLAHRALVVALVVVALIGAGGAVGAAPVAVSGLDRQASTSTPEGGTGEDPTPTPAPAGGTAPDVDADQEARDRAEADLWAVWQVVIALAVVALALSLLLVLYVWATSPRRSGDRSDPDGEPAPFLAALAADLAGPEGEAPADVTPDGFDADPDVAPPPGRVPAVAAAAPARPRPRPAQPGPRPAPARRARRVEAPAKKLATPDAERVLVRPGRAPVRVPGAGARTDGRPPPAPGPDAAGDRSPRAGTQPAPPTDDPA